MNKLTITLNTPAGPQSRAGNRATATRWARFLRELGHRVHVAADDPGERADLMIALHAWRSAEAIRAFAEQHPERPLIVVLTGTDIYRFQASHPETTLASMEAAHALIGLHDRVGDDIPAHLRQRLHTVYQSAHPLPRSYPGPVRDRFDVCVAGHLREEKDSLRAAYAARDLAADSRIRIIQAGRAHSADWAEAADAEAARNPRYQWLGEIPPWQVRRLMSRSRAMVMSSVMEGGANVVSEACVAGLPVLASDIPGNRGLLGDDYAGYYPARDTAALRELLQRAEAETGFLDKLRSHCQALAPRFTPAAERDGLHAVIQSLTAS
jgi:putative glycosyltransferase (TIGR04348 family)